MAGSCIVDDGGDNTDGSTWAKAYTSLVSAIAGTAPGAGDTVYFGHDHIDANAYAANHTITGPSSGAALRYVSATRGTGTIAGGGFLYQKATSLRQIDTSNNGVNTYTMTMNGIFSLRGVSIRSGGAFLTGVTTGFSFMAHEATFGVGPNGALTLGSAAAYAFLRDIVIDLTLDGTTNRAGSVFTPRGWVSLQGLTFINSAYRTGVIIAHGASATYARFSGLDVSGFTNATTPKLYDVSTASGQFFIHHCKTAATYVLKHTATTWQGAAVEMVNVGPANQPAMHYAEDQFGVFSASTAVYRTGGATVEAIPFSCGGPTLGIQTTASASLSSPFCTPWFYFVVSSTGSKTFTVHVGNTNGDLTDAEIWLEVEVKGDASSGKWTRGTDRIANLADLTTAVTQTDDVTSVWVGDTLTYMQSLAVTITVNTTGLGRARVGIGKASILAAHDLYIDPLVTIT